MIDIIVCGEASELIEKVNKKIDEGWRVINYSSTPGIMWNNYVEDNKGFLTEYSCMIEKEGNNNER